MKDDKPYDLETHKRVMELLDRAECILHEMEAILEDMNLKLEGRRLQKELANKELAHSTAVVQSADNREIAGSIPAGPTKHQDYYD